MSEHNQDKKNKEVIFAEEKTRLLVTLGWASTFLSAFVSPLFAIAGIIFGVLINKKMKGRGNQIIAASVILGSAKFVLEYIFLSLYRI